MDRFHFIITENQEINQIEACFIELNSIGYRLTWASNRLFKHALKLPNFIVSGSEPPDLPENKFMVRSMWEYMILNLYKLLEIHDSTLGKVLKELDETKLEKSLEECWKPIKELEEKIRKYRHILAHSKEQANNYINYIDRDPDYYITQTKVIVAAKTAIFYICAIFENLPDVYSKAIASQQSRVKAIKQWPPQDELPNAEKEVVEILKKTNQTLEKNGFQVAHELSYKSK